MNESRGGRPDFLSTWPLRQDAPTLLGTAEPLHDSYVQGKPFPHIVIDDFLGSEPLRQVMEEFPTAEQIRWQLYTDSGNALKLAVDRPELMGPWTNQLIMTLNAGPFVRFLESLTGIKGLVPDPYLVGGGLHLIERGGFLNVHADFNRHPHNDLERRLNLLLYLNDDWEDAFGGHLELWDSAMEQCVQCIAPIANRCVIFSTTSTSYHGHPGPLQCPEDRSRRSIALYYYSRSRPQSELAAPHSTLFQRPGLARPVSSTRFRRLAQRWLPPAVLDGIRAMLARLRRVA